MNNKILIKKFNDFYKNSQIYNKLNYKNYKFYIQDFIEHLKNEKIIDTFWNDYKVQIEKITKILNNEIIINVLKIPNKNKIKIDNSFYFLKNKYFVNNNVLILFIDKKQNIFECCIYEHFN